MNLKISIITPSYNQGNFIEETILSVLDQGYANLEYIIIDGGSTDNSVEIIKKYENRLSYWVSEKDNGQTHAINKGFKMATGDVIAWINSDDVYCKNAFSNINEFFTQFPNSNVVVGNELFMDARSDVYVRKHPNISKWLEKRCMMSILQSSTFLRKSVLTEIGYLNEEFIMMMDAEWFTRINRRFPFSIINKDLSIFRLHQDSKSSSGRNSRLYKRYIEETTLIIEQIYPQYNRIIHAFPNATFQLHLRMGFIMRYLRRLFKGELNKLNDTSIDVLIS